MTPASRVRVASFVPFLAAEGVDLMHRSTLTNEEYAEVGSRGPVWRKGMPLVRSAARLAGRAPDHDLYLVHRLRSLLPLPGLDPPRRLDVYDFDDALFLGSTGAAHHARANSRVGWVKREAQRCEAYLRRAGLVIAGNSFLADHASRRARRVEVVPSCVDPQAQPQRVHEDSEVVLVGWIGSPSTSGYLKEVLPAFERLNRDRLRVKLVLVGADQSIQAPWIDHRRWSLESETEALAGFDIGIMPVADDDWGRGKCGYKILRYFAAGVPAIASPVGVNSSLVQPDRGLVAADETDWIRALEELARDPRARREMGASARKFVERDFSYSRWAGPLAELLKDAAG